MNVRALVGWTAIFVILLAIMLAPFFLYEADVMDVIGALIQGNHTSAILSVELGALLAADVLLPVPSSLVSTICGSLLGFWSGLLVSWIGMTAGCLLGYVIGAIVGRPIARFLAGERETLRVERAAEHYGYWIIILFRAVPVLAEVSVVSAGISRVQLGRFLTIAALSNLGISAAYAAIGSIAAAGSSFMFAFAGAVLVPAISWLITKGLKA